MPYTNFCIINYILPYFMFIWKTYKMLNCITHNIHAESVGHYYWISLKVEFMIMSVRDGYPPKRATCNETHFICFSL